MTQPDVRKLLVIRFGAMGDLLHVSPAIRESRAALPGLEIHLLTSPLYQELATRFEGIHRVWTWDKKLGTVQALWKQLRGEGFDGVVNLHPSLKTWALVQLLEIPKRTQYHKEKLKESGKTQRAIPRRHAVEDFYQPFHRLLGLPVLSKNSLIPNIPGFRAESKSFAAERIAIIPGVGAKRSNRAWPVESWKALIQTLLEKHPAAEFLLIGGPDEAELAQALVVSERVFNHCGQHSIIDTARLLASCGLVFGGDTGPLHLAAAVGTPIVALYGPTAPERTGPLGKQPTQNLLPPDTLDCWPCEAPQCRFEGDQHLACLKDITVGQVTAACQSLLAIETKA